MSMWTGASGTSWGLINDRMVLLIERSIAPEVLQQLAECTDAAQVLDVLVGRGIHTLPGFCLASFHEDRVTAYVRGGFAIRLEANWHDALAETGAEVRTWREVTVRGVSRFAVLDPESCHRKDVPVRSYETERSRVRQGVQALTLAVCETLTMEPVVLITETEPPVKRAFEDLFEDTKYVDVEEAAVREVDDTTEPDEQEDRTTPVPVIPGGSPLADEASTRIMPISRGQLILPGGDPVPVDREVLLGRNPKTSGDARLIAVFDPEGNISRTHARVIPTLDGVTLEDLGSTNGTVLVTRDNQVQLQPYTPVSLRPGDRVILGGDAQIEYRDEGR